MNFSAQNTMRLLDHSDVSLKIEETTTANTIDWEINTCSTELLFDEIRLTSHCQ